MRRTIVLTALTALLSTEALAASPQTEAFVARTRLAVTFLQDSSALAADRSENDGIRAIADAEATTNLPILETLDRRSVPFTGRIATAAMLGDGLQTGRSVAIEPSVETQTFQAPAGTGALMPAAFTTIDHLAASRGGAFDVLYRASQLSVLKDLRASFDAYGSTGDDVALKQMAEHAVSSVDHNIAAIEDAQVGRRPAD